MKVILTQDVEHLGSRGKILNVARGYARNYLVPKGLAMAATPGNLHTLELRKKAWAARETREVEDARAFAVRLEEIELEITKKAGESDTLYGSVTPAEIAELLESKGFEIDRRKIQLEGPIKSLGEFTIPVRLHKDVTAQVKLKVNAETE